MAKSTILPTDPTERRDAKRGLWLLGSIGVAIIIGAASCNGGDGGDGTAVPPPPAAVAPIVAESAPPPPAASDSAKPPRGPATSMGNGTFLVGTDVEPGTYRSDGPLRTSCYWARLSGTGGELDDIIANNLGKGPATVTIKKSDAAFESSGCSRWHKVP